MTSRGEPDRSTGPLVRFPAPVIVVLSSPKVVSDALYLVRYVFHVPSQHTISRFAIADASAPLSTIPPPECATISATGVVAKCLSHRGCIPAADRRWRWRRRRAGRPVGR